MPRAEVIPLKNMYKRIFLLEFGVGTCSASCSVGAFVWILLKGNKMSASIDKTTIAFTKTLSQLISGKILEKKEIRMLKGYAANTRVSP